MNITHTTIKVAWIGALCTLNIVTNGIVVAVIAKYPQLREDRTNIFMLSVMMADMLFGILVMPLSAVLCSSASQSVLAVMPYLPNLVMLYSKWIALASMNSLAWVTLCKMIAITKPFVYERHLTATRCYVITAIIWSIAFLVGLACFRIDGDSLVFIFPLATMLTFTSAVGKLNVRVLWHHHILLQVISQSYCQVFVKSYDFVFEQIDKEGSLP